MKVGKKQLPKWLIPVGAVLVVGIVFLVLFLTGVFKPKTTEVPDVVNMNVTEAQAVLEKSGLTICITSKEINDSVPENTVLRQTPGANEKLAIGGAVNVVISEKSVEIDVPNVIHYKKDLAVKILQKKGFVVALVEKQTDVFANDVVMDQSVTGKAKTGEVITLTIAKNNKMTEEIAIALPNLKGKTIDEAIELLNSEIFIAVTDERYDETYPKGTIILQDPAEKTNVSRFSVVKVVLSKGKEGDEKIVVPSVELTAKSQAVATLENLDLKVVVREEFNDKVAKGVVISQDVPKGTLVSAGSTVTIVVSKGKMPEDYTQPNTVTIAPTRDRNETTTKKNSSQNVTKPQATTPTTSAPKDDPSEKKYVADFRITTDKETASAGDIITVSVKLKTNYKIVAISLPVIYDARVFEVVGGNENNLASYLNFTGTLTNNGYGTNGNWKSPDNMYTKTSNPDYWTKASTKANYKIAFATWVAMPSQGTQLTQLNSEETIVTFQLKVKKDVKDTSGMIFLSQDFIKTAKHPQGILSVGRSKSDVISADTMVATGQTINLKNAATSIIIK